MSLYTELNLWEDKEKNMINSIIEIPMNSMVKYEYDKDNDAIALDRFFTTPMPMPYNYGLLPQTFNEEDGDPLDIILVSYYSIDPGTIATAKVIGILYMEDDGEKDDKIIAIPKKEPFLGKIETLDELPQHLKKQFEFFLNHYKEIDGKDTKTQGRGDKNSAIEKIQECENKYNLK